MTRNSITRWLAGNVPPFHAKMRLVATLCNAIFMFLSGTIVKMFKISSREEDSIAHEINEIFEKLEKIF